MGVGRVRGEDSRRIRDGSSRPPRTPGGTTGGTTAELGVGERAVPFLFSCFTSSESRSSSPGTQLSSTILRLRRAGSSVVPCVGVALLWSGTRGRARAAPLHA